MGMDGVRIPMWTLGDRLRKAREDAGLDVKDMAARMGYHRNSITAYESGDRTPKAGLVRAWADICGVSLEWLCGDDVDLGDQRFGDSSWNAVEQLDLFSPVPQAADARSGGVIWEFSGRLSADTSRNAEGVVNGLARQRVA